VRRRLIAEPQALDPASGFVVPYRDLVKQWDGEYVSRRFVDKRNPQDLIRARPESRPLDHPRPEPADVFIAGNIEWEDGSTLVTTEGGAAMLTEGPLNGEGL
jgi:hypothetical protein